MRIEAVVAARFFGKPLVGFRAANGQAHVLDAHCAHLGAHLGDGKVIGDTLQCPFHGWRYGGDGRCTQVPFVTEIPDGACVPSYPVVERNGVVYFWHDTVGRAPFFEVPQEPETQSATWKRGPVHRQLIHGNVREARENSVDVSHTPILHAKSFEVTPGTKPEVRGWRDDTETARLSYELVNSYGRGKTPKEAVLEFSLAGPGHLVMRSTLPIEMIYVVPNTPVDEDHIVFTIMTWVRRSAVPFVDSLLVSLAMRQFLRGLREDYVIFEKKRYLREPLLTEADGPIAEMRRWLSRFDPPPEGRAD